MSKKLYRSDKKLPYRSSKIGPERSKEAIDKCLHSWGITKTAWDWALDENRVILQFELSEHFQDLEGQDVEMPVVITLKPPTVWMRNGVDIDWRLSMRLFFWYIKNMLAMAYAMQSSKTVAFLAHIQVSPTETLQDIVMPNLTKIQQLKALPTPEEAEQRVIDAEAVEEGR